MEPINQNDLELMKLRFFVLYFRYKYIDAPSTLYAIQDICGENSVPVYKRYIYARNYFNYSRLFGTRIVSRFQNIESNECEKLRKKVNGVLERIDASDIRMSKQIVMKLKKVDDIILEDWISTIEKLEGKPDVTINRYYNKAPVLKLLKNVRNIYKNVQGKYINSDTRNTQICEVIQNFDPMAFYNNTINEIFKFFDVKVDLITVRGSGFLDYLTDGIFNISGNVKTEYLDLNDAGNKEIVGLLERIGKLQKKSDKVETSANVIVQDYRDLEQKKIYNRDVVDELEERLDKATDEIQNKDKQINKLFKNIEGLDNKIKQIKDKLSSPTNTEYKAKEIRKLEKALKKALTDKSKLEGEVVKHTNDIQQVEHLDKMIKTKINMAKKSNAQVDDRMKKIEGLLKKSHVDLNKELGLNKRSKKKSLRSERKNIVIPQEIKQKLSNSQKKLKEINKQLQQVNKIIENKGSAVYAKKPYEKKPYEKKPYEKKPYEKKPYEKKPYEKKPYEKKSKPKSKPKSKSKAKST